MTTDVDICNLALVEIGARSTITSLAGSSVEAKRCNQKYEPTRRKLLRSAPWNFARKFALLELFKAAPGTPEATTSTSKWNPTWPPPGSLYSYFYPDDCLSMRYVVPNDPSDAVSTPIFPVQGLQKTFPAFPFMKFYVANELDGADQIRTVVTDAREAIACYTLDVININLWDDSTQDLFVKALAGELAIVLTGDKSLANGLFEKVNGAILNARIDAGNEDTEVIDNIPDWMAIRDNGQVSYGTSPYFAPYGALFG